MGTEMIRVACENCGANIDLDLSIVTIKRRLNKRIECAICRNARVSRDHDILEQIFTGGLVDYEDELGEARKKPRAAEASNFF